MCTQYPYVFFAQSYSSDLNGTALPYTFTFNSNVDWYGNIGTITVNSSDSYSKTTTSTYANDATHWLLGRLTQSQVASMIPNGGTNYWTQTRTSAFQYPPSLDALWKGVPDITRADRRMIYFLRSLPGDPFYPDPKAPPEETWSTRSYESPPDAPAPGPDVFDVHSLSPEVGLDGVPYRKWYATW